MANTQDSVELTVKKTIQPPLKALRVHGPEAGEFLNRLVISELDPAPALPFTGICNPKGRLLYTFWLLPLAKNDYLLFTDPQLDEALKNFLLMRVFRSQVHVEPADTWLLRLETKADGKPEAVAEPKPDSSQKDNQSAAISQAEEAQRMKDYWLWLLKHHLPWIQPASQGLFIPQQLDLQRHGVVSVDKGCYPGQEIIARLHFLGKNKKHLYHCQLEASSLDEKLTKPVEISVIGKDVPFCDESEIATFASPIITADSGQAHFQLVAKNPPQCLLFQGRKVTVNCYRRQPRPTGNAN